MLKEWSLVWGLSLAGYFMTQAWKKSARSGLAAFICIMRMQVCLAAEECGHLNFDTKGDMWWSSESFHCGLTFPGHVPFRSLLLKALSIADSD